MTHDELLGNLNSPQFQNSRTLETAYLALRAVVELHKPTGKWCDECLENFEYPCQTIQAIEEQLK